MSEPVCEVVITGPDAEWLTHFTRRLVADRLAACGHNITAIRSIYRWDDAIHDRQEARVALHTRLSLVPAITEQADTHHPYDVPCVIAMPIVDGNPDYVAWIIDETRASDDSPGTGTTSGQGLARPDAARGPVQMTGKGATGSEET